jgi:phosphoribosyl 1,2-cyclic phosphodiesterase
MIGYCPLASGSKGNAIFVGTKNTRILIDAGIRMKTIQERLLLLGVELKSVQAILITHEHTDHIAGLAILAEQLNIPILANAETAKGIVTALGKRPKFKIFASDETFHFGDLEIHPFSIPHDTIDPVAFTIHTGSEKLGCCADLGHVTSMIRKQLEGCDYIYLEANHEPSMVLACGRPMIYKTRVLGKQGHLSNAECGKLLAHLFHAKLKHIHLAHLSSECNAEEVAMRVVKDALMGKHVEISIAYQDKLSKPIYFIPNVIQESVLAALAS